MGHSNTVHIRIIESAHLPAYEGKIKIDPRFKWIDDKTRKHINKWLLDVFGGTPLIIQTTSPFGSTPVLICNPEIAHMLRERITKEYP